MPRSAAACSLVMMLGGASAYQLTTSFKPSRAASTPLSRAMFPVMEASLEPLAEKMLSLWLTPSKLVELGDTDKDGSINFDEFVDLLTTLKVDIDPADVVETFKFFDQDNSGDISSEEFSATLTDKLREIQDAKLFAMQIDARDIREDTLLVGLVAHNEMKPAMMDFIAKHLDFFRTVQIVTTGSTGRSLETKLGLKIATKVCSGPLGGDQEIGALISQSKVGGVFFFRDPLSSHPHAADIEALCRICDTHNCPVACNPASGDALVHTFLTSEPHRDTLYKKTDEAEAFTESSVVQAYKARQTAVIESVGGGKISESL